MALLSLNQMQLDNVQDLESLIQAFEGIASPGNFPKASATKKIPDAFYFSMPTLILDKRKATLEKSYAQVGMREGKSLLRILKEVAQSVKPFEAFVKQTSSLDAGHSEKSTVDYVRMINSCGGAILLFRSYEKSPVDLKTLVRFSPDIHPGGSFGGTQAQVLAIGALSGRLSLS